MYFKELAKFSGAIKSRLSWTLVKKCPILLNILDTLWHKKVILGYTVQSAAVLIFFKYGSEGEPVIKSISVMSTPGKKIFKKYTFFIGVPETDIYIINTSQGILHSSDAIKKKLGGEVLLKMVL